jgi:hypothetical protein
MNNIQLTQLCLEAITKEQLEDVVDEICICGKKESIDPADHEDKCPAKKFLDRPMVKTIRDSDDDKQPALTKGAI